MRLKGTTMNTHTTVDGMTDEQMLRNLIQQADQDLSRLKYTDDGIFVSGAYARPLIGTTALQTTQPVPEVLQEERRNVKVTSEIVRLVVAEAGDLAYDFGNFTLKYDTSEGRRISFEGSCLRVWQKVQDEWLIAASFRRPNRA